MAAAVLFLSPAWGGAAAAVLAAGVVVGAARRIRVDRTVAALALVGGVAWATAAASPVWDRADPRSVAVLVDLSPSTRGAAYRDRSALTRRVAELLGSTPRQVMAFADGPPVPLPEGTTLPDLPCDRTAFAPPTSADAVLLFSDGRFPPPAVAPPTFAVLDPGLDHPTDAAVTALTWSADRVTATVRAAGPAAVRWAGATPSTADATGGGVVFARPTADEVTARVDGHDRWPENDQLTIRAPPPPTAERWWVGDRPPPAGFRRVELPTDPAAYLSAGAIVLDDVPADALTDAQQRQLSAYVRDLGGGLVIGGGPHAFAAGGYGRTPIDALSPLSSDPPTPAVRWVVLVDASGSMAGPPWRAECAAAAAVVARLPPADPVRVGSFADGVRWWADAVPAADATARPPPGVGPQGATNLAPALSVVAATGDAAVPTELLLMTDADADPPDVAATVAAMAARRTTLHLLATGDGQALPALRAIVAATGGTVVEQADPARWATAARQLAGGAAPRRVEPSPIDVRWAVDPAGPNRITNWNRTWPRPAVNALAESADGPLAAEWRVGTGHAMAVAFAAAPTLLARLADRVATAPRDPRLTVTWTVGSTLHVDVDAVDQGPRYLNGLPLTVQVGHDGPGQPFAQVGPGSYAADMAVLDQPTMVTVRNGDAVVDRRALAGRYAAEFDAVGTDRAALAMLAQQTGGALVEPTTTTPIRLPGPHRRTPLSPWLFAGGGLAVAAGLVRWRRAGG